MHMFIEVCGSNQLICMRKGKGNREGISATSIIFIKRKRFANSPHIPIYYNSKFNLTELYNLVSILLDCRDVNRACTKQILVLPKFLNIS